MPGASSGAFSLIQSIALFLPLTLPWLNPFSSGPALAVLPSLFSWACMAVLLGVWPWRPGPLDASRNLHTVAWAWLAAGLLSSLIGLCQYFGIAAHFSPWMNVSDAGAAFANLRQRNQFASLTNIALAALLWLGMLGGLSRRRAWLLVAAAVLLVLGNAASSSRTGLLQLVLLCGLFAVWGGWRQAAVRRLLLAALVAYGLATLLLPWLAGLDPSVHGSLARLRAGDAACSSRLTLWSNVLHLIAQKPWFGWGWGELDHAHYLTLYAGERFCDILDNAHNLPLHLAVELGLPLALAVCAGLAWAVWRARPWRETDATRQMAWAVLAVILLHSLLEYPLWYGPFQMAVGLCVWLLWPASWPRAVFSAEVSRWVPRVRGGVAAVLLLALAYAAWDYHRVSQLYLAPEARDAAYREDTMNKVRGSWLFRHQVRFALLGGTPLTRDNAQWTFDTATVLLHFSPEPRVIEKLIESAVMLGRDDLALLHLARYRAAFPKDHALWRKAQSKVPSAPPFQGAAR